MAQADSSAGLQDADLSKLTVPQLKAICKGQKLSGYSKLGKQALLEKIRENLHFLGGDFASACSENVQMTPDATTSIVPTSSEPGTCLTAPKPTTRSPSVSASAKIKSKARKTAPSATSSARQSGKLKPITTSENAASALVSSPCASLDDCASRAYITPSAIISPAPETQQVSLNSHNIADDVYDATSLSKAPATFEILPISVPKEKIKKRKEPLSDKGTMAPPPPKKPRIQPPAVISLEHSVGGHVEVSLNLADASRSLFKTSDVSCLAPAPAVSASSSDTTKRTSVGALPAKRFRPLIIGKSKILSAPSRPPASASTKLAIPIVFPPSEDGLIPLHYLDLPAPSADLPTLRSITLPPSLAQRKRVGRWAIILSGLSNTERTACVLVSRTFRYAVYLSASSILVQNYYGKRLEDDVMRKYSQAMTNMWPYLRVREAEISARRRIYEASFLPRLFRRCGFANPIANCLWASPDDPKQLVIAMRFVLTRAWFELSVGMPNGVNGDTASWLQGTVIDVREAVKGEIWSVTVEYAQPRRQETLYVLEATCEVVGRLSKTASHAAEGDTVPIRFPVRADWSAYISRWSASSSSERSLLSQLRWACHEEYDHGISTLWLRRTEREGELGAAKRQVAKRYILACVVGNSISGEWRSASEMAQDFAGLPSHGAVPARSRTKDPTVNLYLPEHHHIESVHFTFPSGGTLHPALAVVQTPHREYVILRDNGMQVGCEEEGVAAVWQEVLGCDRLGTPRG
ncbi:hypothetical protein BC628DRAFT_1319527 [Trametes gibbosa]|nr:hypothetical protein BC628DRAFT_1319527 [Trametes gibbosa]